MQWLHFFRYKTSNLSLWQKAEAGPKQKGLCSHCSSWPPTKGPLEKHSPWNDQATSPPRLRRPTETAGPNTSCPSPKRLSNSMNTLSTETLEETGACYSAASKPKLFHSHPHQRRRRHRKTCCTYWLLPARRCGSLPLPGSCGQHRHRNLRPACSVVHGQCVERRASHWVAACAENGDCPCLFPPALHPCTTPLSGLAAPLLYSWG